MIEEVTKEELLRLLKQGAELVDVREDEEVCEGAIKGGKHWPLSTFGLRSKDISRNSPTIFYCRSGLRSMKAAEIAEDWTSQQVYSLKGGYDEFAEAEAEKGSEENDGSGNQRAS